MTTLVLWLNMVGAWLLFAGPLYQAALELRAHDDAAKRVRRSLAAVVVPPRISWWWWILPPIKIVLEWRRAAELRQARIDALSVEDHAFLVAFLHKATGWALVGLGGLLLAIGQSHAFAQRYGLGHLALLTLVVVLTVACVLGCALRLRLGDHRLEGKRRAAGSPPV